MCFGEQLDCAHVGTHAYGVYKYTHVHNPTFPCSSIGEGFEPSCLLPDLPRTEEQPKNPQNLMYTGTATPPTNPPSQLKASWLWLLTHEMSCKVSARRWRLPLLQHPQTPILTGWVLQPLLRRFSHQILLLCFCHSLWKGTVSQPHSQPPLNPGGASRCPQITEFPPLNLERKG